MRKEIDFVKALEYSGVRLFIQTVENELQRESHVGALRLHFGDILHSCSGRHRNLNKALPNEAQPTVQVRFSI